MNEINNPQKTPATLSEINYHGYIIRKFSHDDGFEAYYAEDIGNILDIKKIRTTVKNFTAGELVTISERNIYNIITHKKYRNTLRSCSNIILLTRRGLVRLLSANRSPRSSNMAAFFDIDVYEYKFAPVETTTLKIIQDVFAGEKMREQFPVRKNKCNYRIDLYFPDYHLAIECDENNHSDRNQEYETKREAFIKEELGCEFIRYNPNAKNFNINTILNQIFRHIKN